MISITHLVAMSVETPIIDSECSLEKEAIELIYMNSSMVLYLIVNHIDDGYYL